MDRSGSVRWYLGSAVKCLSLIIHTHEVIDFLRDYISSGPVIVKSLFFLCDFVAGALSGMKVDVPPLEEIKHSFCLYFLVPGEYTLSAAAVIDDPNEILRARAPSSSLDEPIICRGPPYHVRVNGAL